MICISTSKYGIQYLLNTGNIVQHKISDVEFIRPIYLTSIQHLEHCFIMRRLRECLAVKVNDMVKISRALTFFMRGAPGLLRQILCCMFVVLCIVAPILWKSSSSRNVVSHEVLGICTYLA